MPNLLRSACRLVAGLIGVALAFVTLTGCDSHPAPAPAPTPVTNNATAAGTQPPPALPPNILTVRLTSGWDDRPVVNARVTINGRTFLPDASGTVELDQNMAGEYIDIDASGFLLRQTRVTSSALTLWPAAAADVEAIREIAYAPDGTRLWRPDWPTYAVTAHFGSDGPTTAALLQRLNDGAARLERLIGPAAGHQYFQVGQTFGYGMDGPEMLVDRDANAATCAVSWGLCESRDPYYTVSVVPEAAARPDVWLRVLAQVLLRPNPQPGLMNLDRPGTDLSQLEQQTIRMIFRRSAANKWPDNDR